MGSKSNVIGTRSRIQKNGCEITIQTDDNHHSQNDKVTGSIIIRTGDPELCGSGLYLQLIEFSEDTNRSEFGWTRTTRVRSIDSVDLSGPFRFLPGTLNRFDFCVDLPMNCRLSDKDGGWYLGVDLIIPDVEDPMEYLVLDVGPSEEIMAVIDTIEEDMRFHERIRRRKWDPGTGRIHFQLFPPRALQCEFDLIALELEQTIGGGVKGDIMFDLQENSFLDYIRSIKGLDRVRRYMELVEGTVLLPDGERNGPMIMEEVLRKMRYVLKSGDHDC